MDIRRYEAGHSDDPSFDGLEHRLEPTDAATELIVEGCKAADQPSEPVGSVIAAG